MGEVGDCSDTVETFEFLRTAPWVGSVGRSNDHDVVIASAKGWQPE